MAYECDIKKRIEKWLHVNDKVGCHRSIVMYKIFQNIF